MHNRPEAALKTTYPEANAFELRGSNDTAVLLLHGFTGTPAELLPVATLLHETFAFTCHGPLLPGHGTTPRDLYDVTVEDWKACANNHLEALRKKFKQIHVVGLSAGGLLCIDLLLKHPDIASAVLLAPAIVVRGFQKWIMPMMAHLPIPKTYFSIPKGPPLIPGHVAYREFPLAGIKQFSRLEKQTQAQLKPIEVPTLTIYSTADDTIDDREIEKLLPYFTSPKSQSVKLTKAEHIIPLSCEKHLALDAIERFYHSLS